MMEKILFFCLLLISFSEELSKGLEYVDTFIGSGGNGFGCGGIPPGAQAPFGMVRLSPDTAYYDNVFVFFQHFGGYAYEDVEIRLFTHLHMVGSGVLDYGMVGVMAMDHFPEAWEVRGFEYRSKFSHENEMSQPGYYSVFLDDWNVFAELSATEHVGAHRYTYQNGGQVVIMDLGYTLDPGAGFGAQVQIDPVKREVYGWTTSNGRMCSNFGGCKVYFSAIFRDSFANYATWNGTVLYPQGLSSNGTQVGAVLQFNNSHKIIEFFVGISFISVDQARANLKTEIGPNPTFDFVRNTTQNVWDNLFSLIEVNDPNASEQDLVKFYSAYYRTLLAPTRFSESGGYYLGFDKKVHQLPPSQWNYYTDMSIWDTHRTEFPWLGLILPSVLSDIVKSLLLMAAQGGDIPRWPFANGYTGCMDGNHGHVVIVDAYFKGIRDFDVETAYQIMKATSTGPRQHVGRTDLEWWLQYGYVRYEKAVDSCSLTLAYSYDDWVVSNLADALGYKDDAKLFFNRSRNYKNNWNSDEKFFCPKTGDGVWQCPLIWADGINSRYVEGDAWHYRFWVPQDVPGLVELFGRDSFVEELTILFERSKDFPFNVLPNPHYWAGNEPDILSVWLFNYAQRPDLTQKYSRYIVNEIFTHLPDGIPGNDDYGTMSAWLVWAALGLYPLSGHPQGLYFLGSPLFSNVTLHRPGFGDLVMIAHNSAPQNIYVEKVTLNGTPIDMSQAFVTHSQLASATLEFWMSPTPKRLQE